MSDPNIPAVAMERPVFDGTFRMTGPDGVELSFAIQGRDLSGTRRVVLRAIAGWCEEDDQFNAIREVIAERQSRMDMIIQAMSAFAQALGSVFAQPTGASPIDAEFTEPPVHPPAPPPATPPAPDVPVQ
jgi:hypothetical protein